MKRTSTLILLTLVLGLAPLASHADGTNALCQIAVDPAGDAGMLDGAVAPSDPAVDITSLSMSSTPESLGVDLSVQDLQQRAAIGQTQVYTVEWRYALDDYYVRATRAGDTWTFHQATTAHGGSPAYQPGAGSIDAAGRTVHFERARTLANDAPDGARLTQVWAAAQDIVPASASPIVSGNAGVATYSDATIYNPGEGQGAQYTLGVGCSAPNDSGERCALLADSNGDQYAPPTQKPDPALDVRSVDVATNDATLVFAMRVAQLDAGVPAGEQGQSWQVGWSLGDKTYNVRTQRDSQGTTFATTDAAGIVRDGLGSLDPATNTITMLVPRRDIPFDDGAVLTDFTASSYQALPASGGLGADQAPDSAQNDTSYVVGAACGDQPALECPVALDPSGDASPRVDAGSQQVGMADGSLDLVAAGADATPDTLSVSARVIDLHASLPPGFDAVGWTISWSFGGTRFVAQAARTPSGDHFLYAATTDDGSLSGPIFDATPTTGTIDTASGVMRVDVPRDAIGAPADHDWLDSFGAVSWAARRGEPTAYHVFDQTRARRYDVGVACGA